MIVFLCRCNGTETCENVITIPVDCSEFMIQCIQCGEFTNILKGLKAVQVYDFFPSPFIALTILDFVDGLQDTEILERTAKRLFKEGQYDKALQKYLEIMNILEDVLAPPFQDYCKCQQAIKDCLLEFGNRFQVN